MRKRDQDCDEAWSTPAARYLSDVVLEKRLIYRPFSTASQCVSREQFLYLLADLYLNFIDVHVEAKYLQIHFGLLFWAFLKFAVCATFAEELKMLRAVA